MYKYYVIECVHNKIVQLTKFWVNFNLGTYTNLKKSLKENTNLKVLELRKVLENATFINPD